MLMKTRLLLVYFCVNLALVSAGEFSEEWIEWKNSHGKIYDSEKEELTRHATWVANKDFIDEHNNHSDLYGFTLKMNQFGDLAHEEFLHLYTGRPLVKKDVNEKFNVPAHIPSKLSNPQSIDYRTLGYVTEVKNQGMCASSWSFAATGALEGQNFRKTGKLISLSEQNLIDCTLNYGNDGCHGGHESIAYRYVEKYGIQSESTYEYEGQESTCKFNPSKAVVNGTGYVQIASGEEHALVNSIAIIGPISVGFDASDTSLQFYHSGVYGEALHCGQSYYALNHAMLVVGYTNLYDQAVYIVKNSWGTGWGVQGYIYVLRGQNTCGITIDATYPTV